MPKFCGSVDAGTQHSGSQAAVGLNCNGVWELKHTDHGLGTGYYNNYWWEVYAWTNNSSSFATRMLRKVDNTWVMIQKNGTIRYTNPSKSSAPPTTGWVTTGGTGATPVPKITFKTIVTEQSTLSLTNCTETAKTTNSVTIRSDSDGATKNIIFGTNTLSVGNNIAIGFKLESSGISNNKSADFKLGGSDIMTGFPFDSVDEGTFRTHSFDQTVGKTSTNSDYTPNSTGFEMEISGSNFPNTSTITIKDLRVFVL
tara:strand:- start:3845 stop:4609 length:765 start_codon:yes stop_codon:yes gene_type:complete